MVNVHLFSNLPRCGGHPIKIEQRAIIAIILYEKNPHDNAIAGVCVELISSAHRGR